MRSRRLSFRTSRARLTGGFASDEEVERAGTAEECVGSARLRRHTDSGDVLVLAALRLVRPDVPVSGIGRRSVVAAAENSRAAGVVRPYHRHATKYRAHIPTTGRQGG